MMDKVIVLETRGKHYDVDYATVHLFDYDMSADYGCEDYETILVLSVFTNPSGVKPVLQLIEIPSELCIYET